jgi:hypothetical protein
MTRLHDPVADDCLPLHIAFWDGEVFVPAMAYAFDRGWLTVCQVLAHKNRADGMSPRSRTRRYQYQPAAPVWLTEGLDRGDL